MPAKYFATSWKVAGLTPVQPVSEAPEPGRGRIAAREKGTSLNAGKRLEQVVVEACGGIPGVEIDLFD